MIAPNLTVTYLRPLSSLQMVAFSLQVLQKIPIYSGVFVVVDPTSVLQPSLSSSFTLNVGPSLVDSSSSQPTKQRESITYWLNGGPKSILKKVYMQHLHGSRDKKCVCSVEATDKLD